MVPLYPGKGFVNWKKKNQKIHIKYYVEFWGGLAQKQKHWVISS
jgi:hypothetical protein